MNKILPVYKPPGPSTYDIIRMFKRATLFKGKIGHGGTLDPFACGVVLILLGKATQRFEEIKTWPKVYLAGLKLGAKSSTQDIEGEIKPLARAKKPSKEKIRKALKDFEGEMIQKVPAFSAAKYKGRPLYELAQQGTKIKKTKKVKIEEIEFVFYKWPLLTIRVTSLGGTYIRQLAEDIGEKLGCGAFLYFLQREKVGEYATQDCLSIEMFKSRP